MLEYVLTGAQLDSAVDKEFRNKHYAHVWKKPARAPPTQPSATPASAPAAEGERLPTPELIASFAHEPIPQASPIIAKTPAPPCPIANVPSEVIVEILRYVAIGDPAAFGRMALVCKRFAYHFAHEQHIWRRICQRPEFGFEGMRYTFACDLYGNPIYTLNGIRYTPFPADMPVEIPRPLSSWSEVFQSYPRIRFTGIYISTVNYTRAGATSSFQNVSWNSPIHIVTYYRYLRFYPDGTVVSLLSTTEPVDVVPHFSKENMMAARATWHRGHHRQVSDHGQPLSGTAEPVPPVAMAALKYGFRGRWRLTPPVPLTENTDDLPSQTNPGQVPESTDPRDLIVETEGVDPKYVYLMHLSLRSPSSSKSHGNPSKNTKLVWRGFWSYNKLTDDWGEFGLRNDRAFVFRRVRGWGLY